MLRFKDIADSADGYHRVRQVARNEVQLLWHSDYWDGPRSGMLLYQQEQCWFQLLAENEESQEWYRRFAILRLSFDQLVEENRWHELFRRCVGTHTDYNHDEERIIGAVRPQECHAEFYDAYGKRLPRDYSLCEVLGWFES